MMSELDRHETSMNDLMARMDDARGQMAIGSMWMGRDHCSGPPFEHMSQTLKSVHSTMSEHIDRMRAAEDLEAARSECRAHTDPMAEMMDGMVSDVESMLCMGR